MTIRDFLEARIEEDEATARAAGGAHPAWAAEEHESREGRIEEVGGDVVVYDEGAPTRAQASHIARWDPARVLVECHAKRATLGVHSGTEIDWDDNGEPTRWYCNTCHDYLLHDVAEWPCDTTRAMAAVWSSHQDYDERWALA